MSNEIRSALAGRISEWTGLAPSTSRDEVLAALAPVTEVRDLGPTERGSSRYLLHRVGRAEEPRSVAMWSTSPQEVVLIEWDEPPRIDADGELDALGAPELDLDSGRVAPEGRVHDLVYAGRGLTVSAVLQPVTARRAVHTQLYTAATTAYWLTRIGGGPRLHPGAPLPGRPRPPHPSPGSR